MAVATVIISTQSWIRTEKLVVGGGIPKFEYFSDIVKGSFRLAELVISFKESVHSYVHVEVGT